MTRVPFGGSVVVVVGGRVVVVVGGRVVVVVVGGRVEVVVASADTTIDVSGGVSAEAHQLKAKTPTNTPPTTIARAFGKRVTGRRQPIASIVVVENQSPEPRVRPQGHRHRSAKWAGSRGSDSGRVWFSLGHPALGELDHDIENFLDHLWVESRGRLIEQHDLRFHRQRTCNGDSLLLAT